VDQVGVFIDFENIVISAEQSYGHCQLGRIFEAAERWGRCIIRRAYGDWTHFEEYRYDLIGHSVDLIQLFHYGGQRQKNAADIQMVVDVLETALTHPDIDTYVLVSGDSDFSAVARKLRNYGRKVIGIGLREATSEVLVKACDQFILYDTLIEPETRTMAYTLERARQLLLDTMRKLDPRSAGQEVLATRLKLTMLAQDPTFTELSLGFGQFKEFLEAQEDLVELSKKSETELVVALKPSATREPLREEMAQYRLALETAGLRLVDPHTRTEILSDLFNLLQKRPGELTLDQASLQLKTHYDTTNVLRTRDEVQEVVKLVRYADVLDGRPQSWELDPLVLKVDLSVQDLVDRCESAYIAALLQKNLIVEPDLLALLLFGTLDQRARIERLARAAQQNTPTKQERALAVSDAEWSAFLREDKELQILFHDLEGCVLGEESTLQTAQEWNDRGLQLRTTDFEQARHCFLRAARMMCELLRKEEPGASLIDLKWYLASYCAAAAGASFFRDDFGLAAQYYQAFFSLVQETDAVWDKVQRLVQPMLSFYFTIAASEFGHWLDVQPGRTVPARILVKLHQHEDEKTRERWQQLAVELARINSALVRIVIQQLEAMEKLADTPAPGEVRFILAEMVREAKPEPAKH
jgi:uncharacterized LabA/DUF88 family protein